MRKVFKNISLFALWLAVAAIWAHMIIPHDHHISESFSDQEQNCPASHNQDGDKSEFPVHCHAFNDIASEKARFYHIPQNIRDGFVALTILPDELISEPQVSCTRIFDFQTLVKSSAFQNILRLRAPPSLA